MPLGLFDIIPNYCPECGHEDPAGNMDQMGKRDYMAGCAHTCKYCGFSFQYIKREEILQAGQDLLNYYGDDQEKSGFGWLNRMRGLLVNNIKLTNNKSVNNLIYEAAKDLSCAIGLMRAAKFEIEEKS